MADPAEGRSARQRESGRRRLPPEERRAEILRAALTTFTELGFEGATLQDVADRAGVTKGALYHYFDSKDDLFSELVRSQLSGLVAESDARIAAADPSLPAEALLQVHLESMWASLHEPHMLELSELIMTELPKFPEIGKAFFEEVVQPSRRTTLRILERLSHGGTLASDLEALAAALPAMLLGVAQTRRVFQSMDPLHLDPDRLGVAVTRALVSGCGRGDEA